VRDAFPQYLYAADVNVISIITIRLANWQLDSYDDLYRSTDMWSERACCCNTELPV